MKSIYVLLLTAMIAMHPASSTDQASVAVQADKSETEIAVVAEDPAKNRDELIDQWIETIAEENELEEWQHAQWISYPLGPGTHGLLVMVYQHTKEIGYLVVHADENGSYQLSEYGVGEYPLFSLETLYQTMIQHELIPMNSEPQYVTEAADFHFERIYLNAFQAYWHVTGEDRMFYFDALTGEAYPLNDTLIENSKRQSYEATQFINNSVESMQLTKQFQRTAFDPYERLHWISHDPIPVLQADDLAAMLEHDSNTTYTALLFDELITMPLPAVGYHQWNNDVHYVLFEQFDNLRAVPYATVHAQGYFYQSDM